MTKEDLAFIRALRDKGVEVTFSQPPQLQQGGTENYATTDPKRILFDPNYTPPKEPSKLEGIIGSRNYDRLRSHGEKNSQLENLYEFFDVTGISSYDDAVAAYDQWNRSGNTYPTVGEAVDMFGAVPALGKLGNIRYLNPNTIKKSFKNIPWQAIVNKADALQDMYQDDTTKDLPVKATPELQGGSVEPFVTSNINVYNIRRQLFDDSTRAYNQSVIDFNSLGELIGPSGPIGSFEDLPSSVWKDPRSNPETPGWVNASNRNTGTNLTVYDSNTIPSVSDVGYSASVGNSSITTNIMPTVVTEGRRGNFRAFYPKPVQKVIYQDRPDPFTPIPARLTTQALSDQLMTQTVNNDLTASIPQENIIKDLPTLTPKPSPIKAKTSFTAKGYPMIDAKNRTTTTVPEGEVWNEKRGWHRKMQEGGMEQQRFSKEDLAFMRALRDKGVEVTFSGYKNDSPDKNNSANLIPSGNITMENVDKPVFAMDSKGNSTVMQPGQNYKFPGNAVLEIPMMQVGGFEGSGSFDNSLFGMDNSPSAPVAQPYNMTSAPTSATDTTSMTGDAELTSGSPGGGDLGVGFNMNTLMAVGSGISSISRSLGALGPESSTEVGSVSGMGGSREQAVEGTIAGTLSSIPIVGQFYQIGSGIGSGFEAGANALYAEGNTAGGEAMTALQGAFDPVSQFGRNAELWEAGYISDAQAVGGLLGGVIFGGAVGMDRRVREIADRQYKGAMTRATGGMHIAGTPSAESAGKFSRATGYPKPKRT